MSVHNIQFVNIIFFKQFAYSVFRLRRPFAQPPGLERQIQLIIIIIIIYLRRTRTTQRARRTNSIWQVQQSSTALTVALEK